MKLLSVCCGVMMAMPIADATKSFYDYRSDADRANPLGCENPVGDKNRYLQIEVFDYNYAPWIEASWTQVSDECGNPIGSGEGASWTMEYFAGEDVPEYSIYSAADNGASPDGGDFGYITDSRLQMDMYVCAPWGNYELTVKTKSSNDGNDMEKIAWEVEYGPDEYHTWDTLNTPFFDGYKATNTVYTPGSGTRNDGDPDAAVPGYAPIPPDGAETTYKWPLDGAEGYYSLMYSGPFPPLTGKDCPNLLPSGVTYHGCYPGGQDDWTTADGPMGSDNGLDPAEPYRLYDGFAEDEVDEDGVMTLEKCKGICAGYNYFGLESAIKGSDSKGCGLDDDTEIPEHKYLCSGDSRVLCGTDDMVSVYNLDPDAPTPTPAPTPEVGVAEYTELGCAADDVDGVRIMPVGPIDGDEMSAEICYGICAGALPGFEYFGLQYTFECWCGQSIGGITYDHDGCTAPCLGNIGETCGGNDAMTVYQVGEVSTEPTPAPTPEIVNAEFTGLGCAQDHRNARVMPVGPIDGDEMSAEICYGICAGALPGFEYFGTQYVNECFCAESIGDMTYDHDGCTASCLGNSGETCGGTDALTVYQVGDYAEPKTAPAPTPDVTEPYTADQCYVDNDGYRIMEDKIGENPSAAMSAQICYDACISEDPTYAYFGLQYTFECWCSKSFSPDAEVPAPEEDCKSPCSQSSQNTNDYCGGFDRMLVYKIN